MESMGSRLLLATAAAAATATAAAISHEPDALNINLIINNKV
jgi:hypothetical protein